MPTIGAHVSTSGGLHNCFQNGINIGAEALQIFGASPRQWRAGLPAKDALTKYEEEKKKGENMPVFLHAAYLVNLATPDNELFQKSITNLTQHLKIANLLGAEGLIYHIGSYKNSTLEESEKRVAEGMLKVLEKAPGPANLIMENASGGGNKMGTTPEEIGAIFKMADHPRIKVCIDTCHAYAAGQLEKFTSSELEKFKTSCKKSFGLKNLTVLHVNDSKTEFNSGKDRHENIGQGNIGLEAFQNLAKDSFFSSIPWLLEVPGYEGNGPDTENMEITKDLFN
jgi:deoxyribonuclease-4